ATVGGLAWRPFPAAAYAHRGRPAGPDASGGARSRAHAAVRVAPCAAPVFSCSPRPDTRSGRDSALFRPRLGHDAFDRHRGAALPLALVGRLHEREQLQRLLRADRRLAGLEELADLLE